MKTLGLTTTRRVGPETETLRPDNRNEETSSTMGGLERADMRPSNLTRSPNPASEWSGVDLRVFPYETSPSLGGDSTIAGR